MPFPFSVRAALAPALLVPFLWSLGANAASVTLNPSTVTRDANLPPPNHNTINQVNFNDCEQNLHLTFPLILDSDGLTNTSYTLVAWAGASGATCTDLTTRNTQGAATQTCWPLTASGIPRAATSPVTIPVRDIFSQIGPDAKQGYTQGTEQACHKATSSGETAITLWFFLIDASGNLAGTPAQFALTADLVGPAAPSSVSAGVGDKILILNWTSSGDPDIQGYNFYCDPPPPGNPAPDSEPAMTTTSPTTVCSDGGFSDAGFDDSGDVLPGIPLDGGCQTIPGTSTPVGKLQVGQCSTNVLIPAQANGNVTSFSTDEAGVSSEGGTGSLAVGSQYVDPAYLCGTASVGTEGNTVPLTNDQNYMVAIAAVDRYGNTGILSTPTCGEPQEVIDFWQHYRDNGGLAGGGFCSVDNVGGSATATPLAAIGGWGIAAFIRRRRKKK